MTVARISDDALAIACGADALAEAFVAAGCAVERVSSWGMHWLEPLVEIDGAGFGPASCNDVAAILDGTSPLGIGPVALHPFIAQQKRLTFARAGKTRPLDLRDYAETGGWQGLAKARTMDPADVIGEIIASGLRGRGGAGFPAGIKWRTVRQAKADRKFIVCNADEGDSASFADRMMMEGDPFQLIEGMAIAAHAVGADAGFIYVRSEYPHAIAKLNTAIMRSQSEIAPFTLEVRVGAGSYVCGEETALLNSLEGKRGEVRAKPPLPALEGLFGKPTVINNVLTLAAVPHILLQGAAHYAALGSGQSTGTIAVQLAGNVAHGGLFETDFGGITLGDLVDGIGGGTASGRPVKAVQVGGPLGAHMHRDEFNLPFDYESFSAADALIGHGGICVFDDSVNMASMAQFAMQFCAIESCGKCTPCRIGSMRGKEILEQVANQSHISEEQLTVLHDLCDVLKSASLCALGGFTPFPVLSALAKWPEDFGLIQYAGKREPA